MTMLENALLFAAVVALVVTGRWIRNRQTAHRLGFSLLCVWEVARFVEYPLGAWVVDAAILTISGGMIIPITVKQTKKLCSKSRKIFGSRSLRIGWSGRARG